MKCGKCGNEMKVERDPIKQSGYRKGYHCEYCCYYCQKANKEWYEKEEKIRNA